MSDKLDFMSERVTAISRPFIVIILAENLLFFLLHLPLSARQADFLSQIKSEKNEEWKFIEIEIKLTYIVTWQHVMTFFSNGAKNWLKIKKSVSYNNKASFVSDIFFTSYWAMNEAPQSFYLTKKSGLIYFIKKTELCDCLDCIIMAILFICISHFSITHSFILVTSWMFLAQNIFWLRIFNFLFTCKICIGFTLSPSVLSTFLKCTSCNCNENTFCIWVDTIESYIRLPIFYFHFY